MTPASIPPESSNGPLEDLSYEQAIAELESVVAALETGDHPLDAALALYERGQALARHCARLLDQAELKIQSLSGDDLVDINPQ
jgi:exodeoxyribonuclease VII small subunit